MKRIFRNTIVIAPIVFLTTAAFSADQSQDESAIRALETRQQEAWNHHDAKAYASLFAEDGDCVNVVGWWWKGSTLTITNVDIRFVTLGVAVAHVRWTMTGARTPSGLPVPQQGIQTHLLQKVGGQWLIAAFQNTNSLSEMPFPKGPAAPQPGLAPKS